MASKTVYCPMCRKPARKKDNLSFPFCSERCKLRDLGKWLDNGYSVPGDPASLPDSDWEDSDRSSNS